MTPRFYCRVTVVSASALSWLALKTFWGDKELGNVGIMGFAFTNFKPITTALRQVTMREIACTIERVE